MERRRQVGGTLPGGDAIQTIEAKFATDEAAGLLEVPFGAPILHVERVMRDEAGAPEPRVKGRGKTVWRRLKSR